jgi:hypothetical protein
MALSTGDNRSAASKASSITETTFEDTKKEEAEDRESATRKDQSTMEPDLTKDVVASEKETPVGDYTQAEDDADYPHGVKLWVILGALMLAVFLVALDQTIISTAIPKITDHFKSIKDIGW